MEKEEPFIKESKRIVPLEEGKFTEGTCELEKATIHFYEFGEGEEKVCFIPPWPLTALTSLPMGEILTKLGLSVTAIDLPKWMGFSELKSNEFTYTFEEYAEIIKEFIEKHYAEDEKIILVGYSMGGLFALYLLDKLGDKIKTAVAISTPYEGISIGDSRPLLKRAVDFAAEHPKIGVLLKKFFRITQLEPLGLKVPNWYRKRMKEAYKNLDSRGVIHFTKQFLTLDFTEFLDNLNRRLEQKKSDRPKVIWIVGEDDHLVLQNKIEKITEETVKEALFFRIKGMDHNGLVTHPKTLALYIGMALTKIPNHKET